MKIVVLDGYTENPGDISWDAVSSLGENFSLFDRTDRQNPEEIVSRIGDSEIVVTNKTPITEEILSACPKIRMIAVLATGYNVVDVEAAKKRSIPVSNVPAYGTMSVAQYSIGLLLEVCHHIGHHAESVKNGKWTASRDFCFWDYPMIELSGKTLGIIGFGRIGKAEAAIAKALGMRVIAYTRHPKPEDGAIAEVVSLEILQKESDVISLHCNLTTENAGMIDSTFLDRCKDGVILINTARGQLLNEEDVAKALNTGKVSAAALDVVSSEPIAPDNPLLGAKNCLITPHVAWASKECRVRIMETTAANIRAFLAGKPQNVVNP